MLSVCTPDDRGATLNVASVLAPAARGPTVCVADSVPSMRSWTSNVVPVVRSPEFVIVTVTVSAC